MTTNIITTPPTMADIQRLPLANAGVYVLAESEVTRTRTHIYQLNQNHVHGWKWRTTKLPHMVLRRGKLVKHPYLFALLVWRVQ